MIQSDIDICARTAYGETRGESYQGMKAVAHVMINRWRSNLGQFEKDDTLATACLRHLQFSCWTKADPNFKAMEDVTFNDRKFRDAWRAVLEALDEYDFTQGSLHYHTDNIKPSWTEGHRHVIAVGKHMFYNTIP